MIFRPLHLDDYSRLSPILATHGSRFADFSFAYLFMWAERYHIEWAEEDGLVFLRDRLSEDVPFDYAVPHRGEDLLRAAARLAEGGPVRLCAVAEDDAAALSACFGARATVSAYDSECDYLYARTDLAAFPGRKYSGKRNHIHAFLREHPRYAFLPIDDTTMPFLRAFYETYRQTEEDADDGAAAEGRAVYRVLDHFAALRVQGAILTAEDRPVGFYIGEVQGDTLFLHIEKALHEVRGAYPFLVQYAAESAPPCVLYENREEDDGDEGLRRSKHSYEPIALLKKYRVTIAPQ